MLISMLCCYVVNDIMRPTACFVVSGKCLWSKYMSINVVTPPPRQKVVCNRKMSWKSCVPKFITTTFCSQGSSYLRYKAAASVCLSLTQITPKRNCRDPQTRIHSKSVSSKDDHSNTQLYSPFKAAQLYIKHTHTHTHTHNET